MKLYLSYLDKLILVYEMFGRIIGKHMSTIIWKQFYIS